MTTLAGSTRSMGSSYGMLAAWSLGLTSLLAVWLTTAARFDEFNIIRLRNFFGYGHFVLAYIFTWRLACRAYGSRRAALGYVGVFLAVVALYAAAQRWWVPQSINYLFIVALFMTHHASNEMLFRQQSANGYRPFDWTQPRALWVALAIGLVVLDQVAFHAPQWPGTLVPVAALWLTGWLVYGWRYLIKAPERSGVALAGWVASGILGGWLALQPSGHPVVTSNASFAWIVIYHYMVWYVFYTRKLLSRAGSWQLQPTASLGSLGSPAVLWRYVTTVPVGFLSLVVLANLAIFGIYVTVDPVARWVSDTTSLNFFQVNTVAHILFGVGLPRAAANPAPKQAGVQRGVAEGQEPQFA